MTNKSRPDLWVREDSEQQAHAAVNTWGHCAKVMFLSVCGLTGADRGLGQHSKPLKPLAAQPRSLTGPTPSTSVSLGPDPGAHCQVLHPPGIWGTEKMIKFSPTVCSHEPPLLCAKSFTH